MNTTDLDYAHPKDAWITTSALIAETDRLKFAEGVKPILRRKGILA